MHKLWKSFASAGPLLGLWKTLKNLRMNLMVFHNPFRLLFSCIFGGFPGFAQTHSPYGGYDGNLFFIIFIFYLLNGKEFINNHEAYI